MNDNKNKIKIALSINILMFILTIVACIIMFTGFKFMHGHEIELESTQIGMLKYFTVESNIFVGLISLLFAIDEIRLLRGKIKEITKIKYIFKLMATTAVGLTFFVVFVYLGPISSLGISAFLMNSNLFFHCIIPVVSILNFIIFERTDKLAFRHTYYGIIPTLLYGIYYLSNVLIHMKNGMVSPIYDWYWFVQTGVWTAIIVVPIIFIITHIISIIIWRFNKKR